MNRKKQDDAPADLERVEGMAATEKALADLEPEVQTRDLHRGEELEAEVQRLKEVNADQEERIAGLLVTLKDCQEAFDNPNRKQQRRKKEKRDPLGVHDFWDGYEQALKDVAHQADGTAYVGRSGQTLSQALYNAQQKRAAQLAEAEADRK